VGLFDVTENYLNIIQKHNMWTSVNEVAIAAFLPKSQILENDRFVTEIATSITFNHTGKDPGEQVVF
jgi:hypothetical protein